MPSSPGISGTAVALAAGGALLVYAGLRGTSPVDALRGVLTGKPPPLPEGKTVMLSGDGSGAVAETGAVAAGAGRAVDIALQQVGKPYRWGGNGPDRFDCSGLIIYSYGKAGITLPRYWSGAFTISSQFRKVPRAQVAAGDVLWKPGHVALATGNNGLVEAPHTGALVRTGPIDGRGFKLYLRYVGSGSQPSMRGSGRAR